VLRLAFAVAAHIEPEIMIVDEALAVGDIAFRHRCMRRIHELRARGTTILFVSHETSDVKALCERCVWLEKGAVRESGDADNVVAKYLSATMLREESRIPSGAVGLRTAFEGRRYGNGHATITGTDLLDAAFRSTRVMKPRERVTLRIAFQVNAAIASPIVGFLVRNSRGENIFGSNTARERYPLPAMAQGHAQTIDFQWSAPELAPGDYRISIAVSDGDMERFHVCDYIEDAIEARAAGGASRGYFQLHCAALAIHRHA
jgi:lipopolysaccharide transport system ATP-binding protein